MCKPAAAVQVVTALLRSLKAPFKESADSTPVIGRLEASGAQVAEWLAADGPALLAAIIPPLEAAAAPVPAAQPTAARVDVPAGKAEQPSALAGAAAKLTRPAVEDSASGSPELQPALAAAAAASAAAVAGLGKPRGDGGSRDEAEGLEEELGTEAR